MRKYLYIFAAATLLSMSGCTSYDEELLPSTDSSSDIDSPVVRLDNGKTGVYLTLVPKSSETIAVTRSTEASGTELNIADGYAFVFKAAKPSVFDTTNSNGYGDSSILLEITDLTINANNVAFFTFDQYPWVKTAGAIDYTRYGAIVDYNYFVDDGGYPILTDFEGTCNYYYNADGGYYAPHVYDGDGNEVEPDGVDKTTYAVSLPDPDNTDDASTGLIPTGLYLIYCYTDSDSCDGYYINKNTGELDITTNGVTDSNGNTILASDLREDYSTWYKYAAPDYTTEREYMDNPIKGINPMCFVRFMVNLTEGTTIDVKEFITQRMVNGGTTGTITTFEDYKHLSVGLDGYYKVEIDETELTKDQVEAGELLEGGTPNPQGTITDGSLAEKYPMASPGIEMAYGLNEYTLYTLDENDKIELVQVGAKVDVETLDDDFSLIGVTLLNGAKRALMRSSVVDITGTSVYETVHSLPLPTNLHYQYRPTNSEDNIDWRNGTIQYNEVLANDSEDGVYTYHNTKDYPIYFFPNEGDSPQNADEGTTYDYSLSHYLAEDFDGISDPVNGFNPTYLIIRGFIAKYHDRNGNGVYDAILSNGTVTDDVGYYKVPIKYTSTLDDNYYTYDIVRCNYYTVQLTSVNNAGYKTFEEAAAGPASDIAYDIAIGGTSDDRNEYATSGGTFYLETDANDIFIKGYDYSDGFEATFDVTLVDNEAYEADTELLTKAADPAYETPLLYLTVTDGITITGYDVKDGASNNIFTADSSTSTTDVYEIDAESGDINTIRFKATKSGVIYVQAGDVMKQINVYYEELAYQTAGDMTYNTATGEYEANTYGFNVDGAYAFEDPATKASFTGINSIEYDDSFYADINNFGNATDKTAEQKNYSQFISLEGRVNDNRYAENGYEVGANYYGHYLNRECRAKAYRSGGYGIAKIYLKQATDFGLLLGDGSDSDAYVASETNITYTSRGYIYDLSFSDDGGVSTNGSMGYNNSNGTITYSYTSGDETITRTIVDGSTTNNPLLFYAAGDPDQVDLMTVTSVVNEGLNTITNEYIYDTGDNEKTVIGYTGYNFCSGGLEGNIEGYNNGTTGDTFRYVANETDISIRSKIEQIDIGEGFNSWYEESTNAGDKFTLWAYPILRNQGTDFDYETAGSEWSYIEGTSFLDDVITVKMTNIAGEVKEYVFNLKQYALPFWDPTLSAEESLYSSVTDKYIDYVTCNLPADAGYDNSNSSGYTSSNGTNYTPYNSSATNNNFIGAFVVYNCIYDNGNDFRWANDNGEFTGVSRNDTTVESVVPVQAFDYNEPDYVVFAPHVNNNSDTYGNRTAATTGTDYMVLTMYNEAGEGTEMAIQITRNDAYIEDGGTLVPFVVNTAVNTDGKYTNLLDFLGLDAYQNTVENN